MKVLGISAFYHDAAACLTISGEIVAAAQEERFTRRKHDSAFPINAVRYCLEAGDVRNRGDLDHVVFYERPTAKFHRLLTTFSSIAPDGSATFPRAMSVWLGGRLWSRQEIASALADLGVRFPARKVRTVPHHFSHAASAYYPSPFSSAAILTADGVGEWSTTAVWHGRGGQLEPLCDLAFPHSLGLLYSAFTAFAGFKVNSGEYKLMGLAPYGSPRYVDSILDSLVDLKPDGSFRLNMEFFGYLGGVTMAADDRFAALFDGPPRKAEAPITRRDMDIAASIQKVTDEIVLRLARHARRLTGERRLCLAGGVALNCVANGRLLRERVFDEIWIQPAAGDAGGAVGAALGLVHGQLGHPRVAHAGRDGMKGSYLGPEFSDGEIERFLGDSCYPFQAFSSDEELAAFVAQELVEGKVVGLFRGRMEFGPRALGNRSIIGDARSPSMQSLMNLKIKYRESFRPFAPSVLEERAAEYFDLATPSPYMLLVAPVKESRLERREVDRESISMRDWVNTPRSDIPAVTHVDYTARVQTVSKDVNPFYHRLIECFEERTGYGVIINTSFNVRGEPIVCSPADAYRCFMRTELDTLVLNRFALAKADQPAWDEPTDWREEFELD